MDEGKPTKAKWWSRPRPDTGHSVGDDGDGDWHLQAPAPATEPGAGGGASPAAAPLDAVTPPGPAPSPAAAPDATDPAADMAGEPGSSPGAVVDSGLGPTPAVAAPTGIDTGPDPSPAAAAPTGTGTGPGPDPAAVASAVTGTAAGATSPAPGAVAESGRGAPRPLHDPDPYSTPPYGEPGPWAPAPPVQHPAATPAHGTPAPQPPYATAPAPLPTAPHPLTPQPPTSQQTTPHLAAAPPPPAGPWQQYDPWAGPVSLSQSGGPVGGKPVRRRRGLVLAAVLIAVVSGGVGGALGSYLERNGGTEVQLPQAGAESTHRAPGSVAGIAARALPGVVTIHTSGSAEQGTGTGFVLDSRGHILTNNHVVKPAGSSGEISVTFAGGESADAEVVGHDTGYDLAVIKVKGVRGLKPLPLGNSENVQVGDPVVAIGAPFDLANTVTSGIISAKERPITAGGEKGDGSDVSYVDALQTDAPINPGNSGGPLVDSRARVIGINSAIRSADSGSELEGGQSGSIGLGFAIPINQAKRVAEELINTGKATHPVIGVTLDMDYNGDGARVGAKGNSGGSAVSPGGPGDKAGIEPHDVITAVDGTRVHSGEELIVKIRAHRPGDKLDLTLERGGKDRKVTLVLGSADGN
ncbi:trypsin-like peptidase domain-containing protein [Streptomyces sp. NPDC052225]|uniref:trypsin-like peptidase domain-containing protein n=1 Tax=Streptomyces sp. NPDC052225 TaxID=3154949 RepID=UPI0034492AEA